MLQEVISRKEAIELGLKRYHGNCSKHGFVERRVSNFDCVVCHREKKRRYRQKHPEDSVYAIWRLMKHRCYNSSRKEFPHYGGRGIVMCPRWLESWRNFLADMGPRPSPKHSIDRIDNDGPYSPENCRWATRQEQNANTRKNVFIEHNGKRQHVAAWSRETGIDDSTIQYRFQKGLAARTYSPSRLNQTIIINRP
jgi:hypothetical protein